MAIRRMAVMHSALTHPEAARGHWVIFSSASGKEREKDVINILKI